MTDHDSDGVTASTTHSGLESAARQSPRRHRTDWRLGGRTVRTWRAGLLAGSFIALGAGIALGALVQSLWSSPWATASASGLLLVGMLVPVVFALRRSRPVGLLRLRPADVLFGLTLALALRIVQGLIDTASGGTGALPSYLLVDGRIPVGEWLANTAVGGFAAPIVEEFFFRGVVLVCVYTLLRRPFGAVTAGVVGALTSTGLFVLAHAVGGLGGLDQVVAVGALGMTCAALVMLTGRIWGAVLVHLIFNASYVALALAGSFLG